MLKNWNYRVEDHLECLGRPKLGVFFGVELEVETDGRLEVEKYSKEVEELLEGFALCKSDGSLNDGFEIVTTPASFTLQMRRWEKFFLSSLSTNLSISERCGMHVHISRAPLGDKVIYEMHKFINGCGRGRFVKEIAGRSSDRWSKRVEKGPEEMGVFNNGKYEALNTIPTKGNRMGIQVPSKTIELRIFASTLEWEVFQKNLEFTTALTWWVMGDPNGDHSLPSFKSYVESHCEKFPNLQEFILSL